HRRPLHDNLADAGQHSAPALGVGLPSPEHGRALLDLVGIRPSVEVPVVIPIAEIRDDFSSTPPALTLHLCRYKAVLLQAAECGEVAGLEVGGGGGIVLGDLLLRLGVEALRGRAGAGRGLPLDDIDIEPEGAVRADDVLAPKDRALEDFNHSTGSLGELAL